MKKLLAIALVLCMVFSIVACTKTPEQPVVEPDVENNEVVEPDVENNEVEEVEEVKEPVTIRFWQAGGDTVDASTLMRSLLDTFEAKYDWITVDYEAIPWSADPHTQFQTAIAAGDVADILVLGSPLDFQLAGEGNLLALDEVLSEEVLADISDVLKTECTYRGSQNPDFAGKMMSVPLYCGSRAIIYNKDIFDFFGVAYPTEQMSHAELLEMAKKLTGDMNGKQVYGYCTRATTSEQYLNFAWNYGGQIVDPSTMQAATDSEAWRKGIEDYLKFYSEGVTPPGSVQMDGTTQLQMFISGDTAMFMGAVDYAYEAQAAGINVGIAALPGETYATSYTGADVVVVPAATQHKEEAALLMNYLMSAEVQAMYCKATGWIPGVLSAANDPFFSEDEIQAGYAATMAGAHYFGNFGVPGVGTILKEQIQQLINGDIDMETYIKNVTDAINLKILEME